MIFSWAPLLVKSGQLTLVNVVGKDVFHWMENVTFPYKLLGARNSTPDWSGFYKWSIKGHHSMGIIDINLDYPKMN